MWLSNKNFCAEGAEEEEEDREVSELATGVETALPQHGYGASMQWGQEARSHMCRLIKKGEFNKNDVFFAGSDKTLVTWN